YGLCGVIKREVLGRQEGESKPRMQETTAARKTLARILAVDHAVDDFYVSVAVAVAAARCTELARVGLGVAHTLGRCGMRRQKIGSPRAELYLRGGVWVRSVAPRA